MSNAIEIHQLHYRAGRTFEIKDLDLSVPSGAIYGFLGPNGSGKTTTIRLALGLLRPLAGRITVLGDTIPENAPHVLARVGFVPEQPHLDPVLTVRETLRFQAAFYPAWDWPWAERLLRQFELLAREPANGTTETWLVRDWEPQMTRYFESIGAVVNDVIDLDLEEGFVELLRTFRSPRS